MFCRNKLHITKSYILQYFDRFGFINFISVLLFIKIHRYREFIFLNAVFIYLFKIKLLKINKTETIEILKDI